MPAANKTDNIELNQWLGNEYPKREDFNADNLKIDTAIKEASDDLATHLADTASHVEVLSLYRTSKDGNGVYVTLEWKRADGTLAKKSVLSGGTSPKYTTRTVTYYNAVGTTVVLTKSYALTYTGDDLTSEVLQ